MSLEPITNSIRPRSFHSTHQDMMFELFLPAYLILEKCVLHLKNKNQDGSAIKIFRIRKLLQKIVTQLIYLKP